jgi:hypothetical protein
MRVLMLIASLLLLPACATAKDPDCAGVDRWPTSMAFAKLKNAGITDNDKLDFSKTKTKRLASEKIGKNLYRQVHQVTFIEKSGSLIEVITVNDAADDECSMGDVDAYLIAKRLGK